MAKWYLYIDDERSINPHTNKEYIWSCYVHGLSMCITGRDYWATIDTLKELADKRDEVIIDLDHDLGPGKSGYDICKWIIENDYPIVAFHLHTMNPVGRFNMRQLLTHQGYTEF